MQRKNTTTKRKEASFFFKFWLKMRGIVNFFDCAFRASSWHFLRPALIDLFVDHWLALTPSLPGYSEFRGASQIFVEEFLFLVPWLQGKGLACFKIN
jgi:hypothetical protein